MPTALITGITGQDGSFLAEHLLSLGYSVVGFARQTGWLENANCEAIKDRIRMVFGDLSSKNDITHAIQEYAPDELYNLASQSRPSESWRRGEETVALNALAPLRIFEAVRAHSPATRVYHASSSEMFGRAVRQPQDENHPFQPVSPYAASKVFAHNLADIFRESYGMFISCGILFNHESERRPLQYLTQKVAYGAACASLGIDESPDLNEAGKPIVSAGKLALGNLRIARDWGYAGDFVKAMHLMLQRKTSGNYVIGTGTLHSLEDLCNCAYRHVGLAWENRVVSDSAFVRLIESEPMCADISKAKSELHWNPETTFEQMIGKMVDGQIHRLHEWQRRPTQGLYSAENRPAS